MRGVPATRADGAGWHGRMVYGPRVHAPTCRTQHCFQPGVTRWALGKAREEAGPSPTVCNRPVAREGGGAYIF